MTGTVTHPRHRGVVSGHHPPRKDPDRVEEEVMDMAGSKGSKSSKGKYRSAKSGRYVTAKHGKSSPRTTVKESRKKS